ncbi:MAG: FIST signal transduction protein [Pseudomonadota bacterium]
MRTEQLLWTPETGWQDRPGLASPDLLLVFGATPCLTPERLAELHAFYPGAHLLGCSTAGEIQGVRVHDDTLTATAIAFEQTPIRLVHRDVTNPDQSRAAGEALARALEAPDLRHVFVLSDGLLVNGTALVEGLKAGLPAEVSLTGGLSGDGARFQRTLVIADADPAPGRIAALGLYGDALRVGYGSLGGWDPFGPERMITRAQGNVLYELDGHSALGLYRKYLGEHAAGLPATGLLFPLSLSASPDKPSGLVRTILAVNEEDQSMTFAGDMPEGMYARLMKANFERLVEGAAGAAEATRQGLGDAPAELAILISCVGRKLVLKQRIEEETEAVRDILGREVPLTGFYSYGEISPFTATQRCELHNQTMTITTLSEHRSAQP